MKVKMLGEAGSEGYPIADNRKRLSMERIQNAVNGVEVREALNFAMNSGMTLPKDLQKILQEEAGR